jgi:uncharacterized membrane protein YkvA (DUF1232 family)
LAYVLLPDDVIPDFFPGIGKVDDAAVIAACIVLIRKDLQKYKTWKAAHPEPKAAGRTYGRRRAAARAYA